MKDIMLSERSQSQKGQILNEVPSVVKIKTQSRMLVARGWGKERGEGELLLIGYKYSVWEDEKNSGDGW